MNKEAYIKPAMEVITIETENMIAASSITIKPGESGGEQLSNDRRGTWGDLWNNVENE